MGLAIWLFTVLAERFNQTRIGRKITTVVTVLVIAWAVVLVLLLTTLMILVSLGYR